MTKHNCLCRSLNWAFSDRSATTVFLLFLTCATAAAVPLLRRFVPVASAYSELLVLHLYGVLSYNPIG